MKRTNQISRIIVALCIIASSRTAMADEASEKAAVVVAEAWLKLVDGGKYGQSWTDAAQLFKGAVTKAQWEQAVTGVRKPLGKLISRKLLSKKYAESLPGAPDGKYVVIQFEASYAKKKTAVETITPMLDPDGKWRVSGYFIK